MTSSLYECASTNCATAGSHAVGNSRNAVNDCMIVTDSDEVERIWNNAAVDWFKLLWRHLRGETEGNYEKHQWV
jgi:hypothetical protein